LVEDKTGVAVAKVEVLLFSRVDVTEATTSETVMVRVRVAVDVRVVVSSAMARRGRSAYARVAKRMLKYCLWLVCDDATGC